MQRIGIKPPARKRGMVLVIVLWIITLLAIMASSLALSMRAETALATSQIERARARALVEAGIAYAITHLLSTTAIEEWPLDGTPQEWDFGAGQVAIAVTAADGKIDLNRGNRELLRGLLQSADVEEEALDGLLDAIEDWRDKDDMRHVSGAESDDYRAAGRSFGPKDAPFESVEELQGVLGMTPEVYQRIASELTVFSRQPTINPATASAELLKTISGIDSQVIDDYIELRTEHKSQGLPPPEPPFNSPYLSQGRTVAYHILVKAQLDSGATVFVETAISTRRAGRSRDLPYKQLAWREGQ